MRNNSGFLPFSVLYTAHLPITVDVEVHKTTDLGVQVSEDHTLLIGTLFARIDLIDHLEYVDNVGLMQPQQMQCRLVIVGAVMLTELHREDLCNCELTYWNTNFCAEP